MNHLVVPGKRGICAICGTEKRLTKKEMKNSPIHDWDGLDAKIKAERKAKETPMKSKGRRASKISDDQRLDIRRRRGEGEGLAEIAKDYGVTPFTICIICKGVKKPKKGEIVHVVEEPKTQAKGKESAMSAAKSEGPKGTKSALSQAVLFLATVMLAEIESCVEAAVARRMK